MTETRDQYLFEFERVTYDITSRMTCEFSDIDKWGEITCFPNLDIKALAEFNMKDEVKVKVKESPTLIQKTYPSKEDKNKIIDNIIETLETTSGVFSELALDDNFDVIFGKRKATRNYEFLGIDDPKIWKRFDFVTLRAWFDSQKIDKKPIFWRVGDFVFRGSEYYIEKALAAIVLNDWCDRFVPTSPGVELVKVTLPGFAMIFYYLICFLGKQHTLYFNTISKLYTELDKIHAVPLVPRSWREDDIGKINFKRLDAILKEILNENTKNEVKKLENNPVARESGTDEELQDKFKEAHALLESQHKNAATKYVTTIHKNESIKLSNILSPNQPNEIWSGEYFVDIDTPITERGVSIIEREMLVAIMSFGVLEILVEEGVMKNVIKDIEESIEEKFGIAMKIYDSTQVGGRDILDRGGKINA